MDFDQEQVAKDEIDRLAEFFDVDVEYPEFGETHTIPRVQGDGYSELKLNPYMPWGGKHESRHVVHRAVLEDVVERNPEEAVEFYEGELKNLDPSTSFYTAMVDGFSYALGENTADDVYEEAMNSDDVDDVAHLIFSKNAETDLQAEVFAHDSNRELVAGFGGAAIPWFINFGKNMQNFQDVQSFLGQSPEAAVIAGISLPAGYLLARDAYDMGRSEGLTESNLREYSEEDRKRAMLYNSQLESNMDEFLSVLDEYGIE
jgi:hypothetical protein